MKEIKFRAIIKDKNAVIYFTLQDLLTDKFSNRELLIPWLKSGNQPDRYIDIKDRNEKDVYESDIVTTTVIGEKLWGNDAIVIENPIGVICYIEHGFSIKQIKKGKAKYIRDLVDHHAQNEKVCEFSLDCYDGEIFFDGIEIIGNRHENPELIEVKK